MKAVFSSLVPAYVMPPDDMSQTLDEHGLGKPIGLESMLSQDAKKDKPNELAVSISLIPTRFTIISRSQKINQKNYQNTKKTK